MKARYFFALLLVPSLAALGCSQSQRSEESQQEVASDTSTAMGMATQSLALHTLNDSEISGSLTLTHSADTLTMELDLDHLTPGSDYVASIHHGSCEVPGPEAMALKALMASAEGTGSSTTMVPLSVFGETATEQQYEGFFVQVIRPDAKPAACVDLPSEEEATM